MLVRLHIQYLAPPATRDPHGEIQAALRIDPAQARGTVNARKLRSPFFGHFPPERIQGIFTRLDMPAGEVPHVRIRQPRRAPVTKHPEPAVVRDRVPGRRAAGLDPAAGPDRARLSLGTQTARLRIFSVAGRLARGRRLRLRLAERWPWVGDLTAVIIRLQALRSG